MRKASTDKHQLMGKASTSKDMSMDMLYKKLSIDTNRSIKRQNDRESNMQSGADMATESEFVDPGGYLVLTWQQSQSLLILVVMLKTEVYLI